MEVKENPDRSVFLCPIEPRRFEKEVFRIEDVDISVRFRMNSRNCSIQIPLIEIHSIEKDDSKVTLNLEGKLVYTFNTSGNCMWRYIPPKTVL